MKNQKTRWEKLAARIYKEKLEQPYVKEYLDLIHLG